MSYGFASNLRGASPNASFIGFTGTLIQRQRRGLIPVWGNAPGNGSEMGQGLKARSIPPPMCQYHVTSINANAWSAPLALGDLLSQFHGALPHAGMTAGRWLSPERPSRSGHEHAGGLGNDEWRISSVELTELRTSHFCIRTSPRGITTEG